VAKIGNFLFEKSLFLDGIVLKLSNVFYDLKNVKLAEKTIGFFGKKLKAKEPKKCRHRDVDDDGSVAPAVGADWAVT
jgi:hypothetical protein